MPLPHKPEELTPRGQEEFINSFLQKNNWGGSKFRGACHCKMGYLLHVLGELEDTHQKIKVLLQEIALDLTGHLFPSASIIYSLH